MAGWRRLTRAAAAATGGGVAGAVLAAPQVVTNATAVYWIDATTETGMAGSFGRMSMGDMMAMATGGAGGVRKSLWLRLGSDQPSGDPRSTGTRPPPPSMPSRSR